tara:strand:- start:4634 stop:5773 length:1140 start_codon:yes stop_codon:yes gene_type:complete
MFKIPLEDVIAKIKEKAGISEEEINTKIKTKLDQLSGLISKEGAAHIIANELGVKVIEQVSGKLQIKNILPGMRSVETVGKVTQKFDIHEFQKEDRKGKLGSMVIGDETGTIRIVLWQEQADKLNSIKEGDIIKIKDGYSKDNQGKKEVHISEKGTLIINPPDETIGDIKLGTSTRKNIKDLRENDDDAEILGTIVQVFDIRFFEVCPECGKRARPKDDGFECITHNKVTPAYSYVLNVHIDDGTENIRIVCFRNQVEQLLNKTSDEILSYKESPDKFEEVKTELLGNQIKIIGRVSNNTMFNRLEFVCSQVFPSPDPSEEIKRLEENNKGTEENTEQTKTEEPQKPEEPQKEVQEEPKETKESSNTPTEEIVEDVVEG